MNDCYKVLAEKYSLVREENTNDELADGVYNAIKQWDKEEEFLFQKGGIDSYDTHEKLYNDIYDYVSDWAADNARDSVTDPELIDDYIKHNTPVFILDKLFEFISHRTKALRKAIEDYSIGQFNIQSAIDKAKRIKTAQTQHTSKHGVDLGNF